MRSADRHVTRTRYSIQVQYPHAVAANNMAEEDRDAHEHAQSAAELCRAERDSGSEERRDIGAREQLVTAAAEERDFYHHGSGEGMDMSSGKEKLCHRTRRPYY